MSRSGGIRFARVSVPLFMFYSDSATLKVADLARALASGIHV